MTAVTNRIRALRKAAHMTQSELGDMLGIATNTVCQYELGIRQIPDDVKYRLCDIFGVSLDYLLDRAKSADSGMLPIAEKNLLPIIGTIRAGTPIFAEENIIGQELVEDKYLEGHFYLRVEGNSMEPTVRENSLALIKCQDYAKPNQIVAVLMDGSSATLKRYKPLGGGLVLLQADNPSCDSYTLTTADFDSGEAKIMGVLVKIVYYFD